MTLSPPVLSTIFSEPIKSVGGICFCNDPIWVCDFFHLMLNEL